MLTDNRLAYGGFFPQHNLTDDNYGLRKAIAHSQMYEKDEEYIKTDMLRDTYDIMIKAHHEKKLGRPYSPLEKKQLIEQQQDDTNVQSLTGTSSTEKRAARKQQDQKSTDKSN